MEFLALGVLGVLGYTVNQKMQGGASKALGTAGSGSGTAGDCFAGETSMPEKKPIVEVAKRQVGVRSAMRTNMANNTSGGTYYTTFKQKEPVNESRGVAGYGSQLLERYENAPQRKKNDARLTKYKPSDTTGYHGRNDSTYENAKNLAKNYFSQHTESTLFRNRRPKFDTVNTYHDFERVQPKMMDDFRQKGYERLELDPSRVRQKLSTNHKYEPSKSKYNQRETTLQASPNGNRFTGPGHEKKSSFLFKGSILGGEKTQDLNASIDKSQRYTTTTPRYAPDTADTRKSARHQYNGTDNSRYNRDGIPVKANTRQITLPSTRKENFQNSGRKLGQDNLMIPSGQGPSQGLPGKQRKSRHGEFVNDRRYRPSSGNLEFGKGPTNMSSGNSRRDDKMKASPAGQLNLASQSSKVQHMNRQNRTMLNSFKPPKVFNSNVSFMKGNGQNNLDITRR